MAKYQQYEEYKDSKIESLGMLPSHWVVKSLSKATKRISVGLATSVTEYYRDEGIPIIRNMNIKEGYFDGSDMLYLDPKFAKANSGKVVFKGDVIAVHTGSNLGLACIVPDEFNNCHTFTTLIVTTHKYLLNRYLTYCINSAYGKAEVNRLKFGFGKDNLNVKEFNFFYTILPEFDEQLKIANFLDHETAQIDTLIEKQQTLIQLLKEKRQAVISHAVTKGLNPDALMKDSGVEWLGEVPKHWEVIQAKYIADITRGAILRPVDAPEYFDENGEWSYLNISDATKCDKYLYESKLRLSPLGSKKSARVYPNNLIITASATIGKAFINKVKVCVHDGFIPFCNIKVDINYLYHYVSNPYLYAAMGKSNTQKNIYLDEVKNMIVTVPSREEQEKIVEHIEKNQNEYSKLIDKAQKAIQLMQERRTALISAAVTGKIDVRGWRASE